MAEQTPTTPWFGVPNDRQEALRIGHPYYFTGKPCKHGHLSNRDSKDRKCQECELIFIRKRVKQPAYKAKFLAWSRANKDKRKAAWERSKKKHREKVLARLRQYYADNLLLFKEKSVVWRKNNKPKIYAANAARRFRELMATPPWAETLYQHEFEEIYAARLRLDRETGVKHHVDHIYPLKGTGSCGLHVPWNLRIIPARKNMQKRNHPPENIIMSLTESGWRYLGEDSRNNAVHVDTSIKQTSELLRESSSLKP